MEGGSRSIERVGRILHALEDGLPDAWQPEPDRRRLRWRDEAELRAALPARIHLVVQQRLFVVGVAARGGCMAAARQHPARSNGASSLSSSRSVARTLSHSSWMARMRG